MAYESVFSESVDLLLIVERLSAHDQHRIVRLIKLLCHAPDWLREETQRMLVDLLTRDPQTRADCLVGIDAIIARSEQELEYQLGSLRIPSDIIDFASEERA